MKSITIAAIIFLLANSNLHSQDWESFITLPGSGTTSMKMNSNGDLFFTTASYNYPNGQSAGVYRILNGSFITTPVNPTTSISYNARTVETEGSNDVWISFWGNPSTMYEGLYRSTNNGNSWTRTFDAGPSNNIFSIKADPDNNNVYAGTRNGVYKSTNNGLNFSISNSGMTGWVYTIEKASDKLLAGTSNGLYRSTNEGASWTKVNGIPLTDTVKSVSVIPTAGGERVIAGTDEGELYMSDEEFVEYALLFGFDDAEIIDMLMLPDDTAPDLYYFYVSSFPKNFDVIGTGLFYSYSSGTNWVNFDNGLPLPYRISAIGGHIQGSAVTMFAGTFNNSSNGVSIYKKSYTVSVNNVSSEIPESFSLEQNYPNPFNPVTKIKFRVNQTSDVKLVIYNSIGKEISTPVNQKLNAGTYETEFNAASLNSGVYFYKIISQTSDGNRAFHFTETKKMMLIK